MTRSDFLAERKTGIGSSDAASLMNVGYGCKRRLFYDKIGVPADYPFEGNNLTELGQVLEPYFRRQYGKETQRVVQETGLKCDPFLPFLLTHLDGIVYPADGRDNMIMEIKSLGRAMFYKVKREGISEDYILQVQWSLMVTGWNFGVFVIGSRDSGEILHFEFAANKELGELLMAEGVEFWKTVEAGRSLISGEGAIQFEPSTGFAAAEVIAPDRLSPDDARCHRCEWRDTCQGNALMEISKKDDGSIAEANELFPLYAEYKQRAALVREAEDLLEETKEELKTALGDKTAVSVNGRKILYRPQTTMRWDGAELAGDYEEIRGLLRGMAVDKDEFDKKYPPAEKKPSISRPLRLF